MGMIRIKQPHRVNSVYNCYLAEPAELEILLSTQSINNIFLKMGSGGYASDMCSLPGILKICEMVSIFITLLIHRHGDNGEYMFFATTGSKLDSGDENIDAKNLGNSVLVTYMVISIVLTIGYVLDGREAIQSTILEIIWNFLAILMFLGAGCMAIITWQEEFSSYDASSDASKFNGQAEFQRNAQSAMAMGSLCIITGPSIWRI